MLLATVEMNVLAATTLLAIVGSVMPMVAHSDSVGYSSRLTPTGSTQCTKVLP